MLLVLLLSILLLFAKVVVICNETNEEDVLIKTGGTNRFGVLAFIISVYEGWCCGIPLVLEDVLLQIVVVSCDGGEREPVSLLYVYVLAIFCDGRLFVSLFFCTVVQ